MPPRPQQGGRSAPAKSGSSQHFKARPEIAFAVFLTVNLIAALKAPITDCDETYNYWEPTHYLSHGYGLQTWEYSPEYAIRSWTYIAIHAVIGRLGYLVSSSKTFEFYWIRCILATLCALCETRLFTTIAKILNPRVSIMFMIVMLSSTGMFSASSAYLPSSFAMYANMLGASAFMDWRDGSQTATGIMWFGIGGIIGWPFSAALVVPFLLEDLAMTWVSQEWMALLWRSLDGCTRLVALVIVQLLIETFFYHKPVLVPWNIVAYNIFSGADRGPDIFGTEPADFYIRNLLLNFSVWTLLALAAGPLLVLQYLFRRQGSALGIFRSMVFVSPFYMWLLIFSSQRHKEERFMYPAYPFIALNAAIGLHTILGWFGNPDPRTLIGRIPPALKLAVVASGILIAVATGVLRTIGNVSAYSAPLQVYDGLATISDIGLQTNLCLGKEWYRLPTSYFLPNGVHARFIKSEFRGLLPGQFSEAKQGSGVFPGTWLIPEGMNDRNIEDPNKYIDLRQCDFLVDSMLEGHPPTALEPAHIDDTTVWEPIRCESFLDASNTNVLARLVWIPNLPIIPHKFRRQWGQYCLMRRRANSKPRPEVGGCVMRRGVAADLRRIPRLHHHRTVKMYNYNEILTSAQRACNSCAQRAIEWYHATPHANIYVLGVGLCFTLLLLRSSGGLKRPVWGRPRSPDPEKRTQNTQGRFACVEPGVWVPSDWKRPDPQPYPNWDIHTTKPLPYRPFKWGPYFITMGTRSMKWDDWIEIDNEWQKFQDVKAERIKERGERLSRTDPEALEAAYEMLEEFCDYLPKRYPSMFRKTDVGMDNLYSGEKFNIVQRPLGEDPMQMAARIVQDDLAIMIEKPDGEYYLLAGSIIIPGSWRLEDKFRMRLSDIHISGHVPGFKAKLEKAMMNFFRRMQPKDAVIRHNYLIQLDDNLAWSDSIGLEDEAGHGLGSDNTAKTGWQNAEKDKPVEYHYYRSERQTLCRLPRSGGVVFTIRTYFHPVMEIAQEPGVAGRLASAVRSWGPDVQRYKGQAVYKDVLLEYLDKKHEEQLKEGLVTEGEEENQNYPW